MICLNSECQKDFIAKTHNQKYCSDECCRVATNKRIMEKYYEKKEIKNGAPRKCKSCPGFLSRYNDGSHCSRCIKIEHSKYKNNLMGIINDIG